MRNILIFTEDSFGVDFINKVILNMKQVGLVNNSFHFKCLHLKALCNKKIDRQIRATQLKKVYDRIIIVIDGDFNPNQKYVEMRSHVEKKFQEITKIVVIETEIEEWICKSLKIKFNQEKPSSVLNKEFCYEKYKLPKYNNKLDYSILTKDSTSFIKFLNYIQI